MNYLFLMLPKILFYPVYAAGWCSLILCCPAAVRKLYLTGGKHRKSLLILLFTAAVLLLGICPIRSARYIFMLIFPFTFLAAVFFTGAAECFGRKSAVMLCVFTLAVTAANTLKVLHTDSSSGFAEKAAVKLRKILSAKPQREILLLGTSRDLGRIAYHAGFAYRHYPYPVEDALDLVLLKEHFGDRYKTFISVYDGEPAKNTVLPAPFLTVRKKHTPISFHEVNLSSVKLPEKIETGEENLFKNADLSKPMGKSGIERIKTYFKDNPEVLKTVNRPDFVWPYAWPFDHAGNSFPGKDFQLQLEKTPQGENAIHLRSRTVLPFYHSVEFPLEKNYLLSMKIQFLEESEISVKQLMKPEDGKKIYEEIKLIYGKAGSERTLQIPVYPGKLLRLSEKERQNGSVNLFFALNYGNVRFSTFKLQEIKEKSLCRIKH